MPKRKFQNQQGNRPKVKRTKWNKRRPALSKETEVIAEPVNSYADDADSSDPEILNEDPEDLNDDSTVPAVRLLAATFDNNTAPENHEEPSADHKKPVKSSTTTRHSDRSKRPQAVVSNTVDTKASDEVVTNHKDIEEEALEQADSAEDPFVLHFELILSEEAADSARKKENISEKEISVANLGSFVLKSSTNDDNEIKPENGQQSLEKSHVRLSLVKNVATLKNSWTPISSAAFAMMNSYRDVFHFEKDYRLDGDMKRAYCLHTLNHILKGRSRVIAHNAKITRGTNAGLTEFRDQGFTRPKVLIIVPFKQHAFHIYEILSDLLTAKDDVQVMNKARFESEFSWNDKDPVANLDRPEDFRATFAGNTDDCFRVGISVTKKSLKLYAEFYSADIIIASPLGLRMIIGTEGEKQHEYDFLSSIEILILDQADIFMMQNWEHILWIMKHLHRQPKTTGKVDFSRVRPWVLNGWGQLYRQTILLSAFRSPELQALMNRSCSNFAGSLWLKASAADNTLSSVVVPVPHCFHRVPGNDFQKINDARFKYFTEKILPQLNDVSKTQTMIFIPSYFDFVRIRNHFKREDISFVQICEYTATSKIARARDLFFHGKKHFLLYTERFHFYRRYRIRGIRHILFYDLPHYPHFYSELCNMMMAGEETAFHQFTSDVLYSKFDSFKLSPIVGLAKVPAMLQPDKPVHMFVTSPAESS